MSSKLSCIGLIGKTGIDQATRWRDFNACASRAMQPERRGSVLPVRSVRISISKPTRALKHRILIDPACHQSFFKANQTFLLNLAHAFSGETHLVG